MNRRVFLASLPLLPAAVKAIATEPELYKCVITPNLTPLSRRVLWFIDWSDINVGVPPTPIERARRKLELQRARPALPLP